MIKCAWCGKLCDLTKNKLRPKQHTNGKTTCVGSGQLVITHKQLGKAIVQEKGGKLCLL